MSLLRRYLLGVLLVTSLTFACVSTLPPLVQAADHECQYQLPLDPYLDQQAREEFKDDWYWDKTCVHQKEEADRNRTIMFVGGGIALVLLVGIGAAYVRSSGAKRARHTAHRPAQSNAPAQAADTRLNQLISAYDRGLLTKEEFERAKQGVVPSAAATAAAAAPAAGWYPDPDQNAPEGRRRYWDGTQWGQWDPPTTT